MENKLQELTRKLYDEGLEKGRADADKLVADVKAEAARLVAEAKAEAEAIVKAAEAKAEDLRKNSMAEISLAGKQAVAKIKEQVAEMIIAKSTVEGVKAANLDAEFVKNMLVEVAHNWNGASSENVSLEALLPEAKKAELKTEDLEKVRVELEKDSAWNDLYSQCTNANAKVEAHSRERLGIVRERITPKRPKGKPVSK
jgi:V/A-type H+-transporting ATPase subunit E